MIVNVQKEIYSVGALRAFLDDDNARALLHEVMDEELTEQFCRECESVFADDVPTDCQVAEWIYEEVPALIEKWKAERGE